MRLIKACLVLALLLIAMPASAAEADIFGGQELCGQSAADFFGPGSGHPAETARVRQTARAEARAPEAPAIEPADDIDISGPVLASLGLATYHMNPLASEAVERSLSLFSERLREKFSLWLMRSGKYLPMMTKILEEEGIPAEMAYLPLIESGFNPRAYSRSKAAGPWQFIAATAKRYGLKVNKWVDERRDPVKSTRAAARYLRDLYDMFGNWSLAMAAYNAGESKIKKALRKLDDWDYWGLQRTSYIRRETKDYVPRFIAARLIAESPEDYGFFGLQYHREPGYDEVPVNGSVSLDAVARCAETSIDRIKELNPELRRSCTPPVDGYRLKIPAGKGEAFMKNLAGLPKSAKKPAPKVYVVRKGDTVGKISRKTGTSKSEIIALNNLGRKGVIRPGQRLELPD
jgi:membrane-bound lytic murein transglycosylase D